ncbi:hypothetical protein [Microbacterium schleiferi]|uniref:hypothetical protein n=1 Tax=Microbacterium schleiferi TaxID=69362 RepID=UPI001D179310|nr:hypothetical protein [Microbacterium schleiferi]MCC4266236.1 hypothetical protein [Microbacterium schleiferi]
MVITTMSLLTAVVVAASAFIHSTPLATATAGHSLVFLLTVVSYRIITTTVGEASQIGVWLFTGLAVFAIFFGPESDGARGFEGLWKFGLGYPLTFIAVYLVTLKTTRVAPVFLTLLGLGAFGTVVGARAYGLVCFASGAVILARGLAGRRRAGLQTVFVVIGLGVLAWGLPHLLESGFFGADVAAKTSQQVEARSSALLGGRTEPPLSLAAISVSPWIGWGSVQAIDSATISLGSKIASTLGLEDPSTYMPLWVRSNGEISLHSILFTTWVEGGVVAALFPILLCALLIVGGLRATGRYAPLVTVVAFQAAWTIVFSPWTGGRGVQLALAAILAMLALAEARSATQGEFPTSRSSPVRRRVRR